MDEEEKARRVQELYREALDLAEQAVLADRQKQFDVAICLYNEAAKVFNQIIDEDLETTDKIIQIQQKANEYVTRASFLTSKNMNYSHDSYINPDNITELPSLYHIVGSFVENNRNNSSTSLEAGTSRPNNTSSSNNFNYSDYSNFNIDSNYSNSALESSSNFNYNQSSPLININTAVSENTSNLVNKPSPLASTPTSISTTNSNTNNTNTNVNTTANTTSATTTPSNKATTPTSATSAANSTTTTNNQNLSASEEFNDMKYVIEEMGTWNSENAGGSISNYTFYKNPQYKLNIYPTLGENGFLKAIAKTKNNLPVNIRLVGGGNRVSTVSKSDITSGAYRHGHCSFEILSIEPGDYTIIISTFHKNEEGEFSLTIGCSIPFSLTAIPPEGDGMLETVIDGQWIQGVTAMGCVHYNNYFKNPTYKITVNEPTYILIRLQIQTMKPPGMHVAIFELIEDGTPGPEIASSGAYSNLIQGVLTNKILLVPETEYIIIFSTWEPSPGPFTAFIYTSSMIEIQEICHE
jgi:hypothetical protein